MVADKRRWDRRKFLKAMGVVGAGVVVGGTSRTMFDVARLAPDVVGVTRTRIAMGTFVTITAVHESRHAAEAAIGATFEEMDRLIAILSRHDSSTPLSVLNSVGSLQGAPLELTGVLHGAREYHDLSGGAFDVTVGPLVDLFAGTSDFSTITPLRVDETLARVDGSKLSIDRSRVKLHEPGMAVTLDSIAKGFIADRLSDNLAGCGVYSHLVNAGGDIRTRGVRANGRAWRIAVQDPDKAGAYPDVIELIDGAVATSGSYEVFYDREKVFHHLVDPRKGQSPRRSAGVSVISTNAVDADALSTSVFVLGPERGLELIEALPGRECLVVTRNRRELRTRGWPSAA